jgi:hypothetical protein
VNWLDPAVIGVAGVIVGSVVTGGWQLLLERGRRRATRVAADLQVRREATMSAVEAADALVNQYRNFASKCTPSDLGRPPTGDEDGQQLEEMLKLLAAFEHLRVQSLRYMVLGTARTGIAVEGIRQEARDVHNRMLDARILTADDFNATMDKLSDAFGDLMLIAKESIGTEPPSRLRAWAYRLRHRPASDEVGNGA